MLFPLTSRQKYTLEILFALPTGVPCLTNCSFVMLFVDIFIMPLEHVPIMLLLAGNTGHFDKKVGKEEIIKALNLEWLDRQRHLYYLYLYIISLKKKVNSNLRVCSILVVFVVRWSTCKVRERE